MNNQLNDSYKFSKKIFDEEQLKNRVEEIGKQITQDYRDKENEGIIVVCVLKGSVVFMSDLVRNINLKLQFDFISASSYYNDTKSSGQISIDKDVSSDIKEKHVIIVEDIVDSGLTLEFLYKHFKNKGAASIEICTLLNKNIAQNSIDIAYTCFDCPDEFIVGYGIDYAQMFRNLPFISSLEKQLKD